jgi:CBS domain-containing protein
MIARSPRVARRKQPASVLRDALTVPEVLTSKPAPAPPQDEPEDEAIRRMVEAAYAS